MFALFPSRIFAALPVTVETTETTIEILSAERGENWAVKTYGQDIVALVTGGELFDDQGKAEDNKVGFRVSLQPAYRLVTPVESGMGAQNVEVEFPYKYGGAASDSVLTLVFEDVDEIKSQVRIHVIPAILREVTFEVSTVKPVGDLQRDDGTAYSGPHWLDENHDGIVEPGDNPPERNYPVAYVRKTEPEFSVVVKLGAKPPEEAKLCLDADSDPQGVTLVKKPLLNEVNATLEEEPAKSSADFLNFIRFYDSGNAPETRSFDITWKIGLDEELIPLQESRHTLYLLADEPIPGAYGLRESMLYYACRGGVGADPIIPSKIAASINNEIFRPKEMYKVVPGRAMYAMGTAVLEYKESYTSGYIPATGGGQCGGWSQLKVDVVKLHGCHNISKVKFSIDPAATYGNKVPNQWFVRRREPFEINPSTTLPPLVALDGGQGGVHTFEHWGGHIVVGWLVAGHIIGPYYDPSYGNVVFSDVAAYEAYGVAGFEGWAGGIPYYWRDREGVDKLETSLP